MNNHHPSGSFTTALEAPFSEVGTFHLSPWLRLSARLLAPSLDQKLATGQHPATSGLLAARCQQLVSAESRHGIAESWLCLLVEIRRPYNPFDVAVPLARNNIVDAEHQIRSLAAALVGPLPTVRGVAMAIATLRDGAGPLFNRNSDTELTDVVDEIIAKVDPLA